MSTGSTSQSYATVAPLDDSRKPQGRPLRERAPLPPFWEYQDKRPAKVDVAPVGVVGAAANDGVA